MRREPTYRYSRSAGRNQRRAIHPLAYRCSAITRFCAMAYLYPCQSTVRGGRCVIGPTHLTGPMAEPENGWLGRSSYRLRCLKPRKSAWISSAA